MNMINLYAKNIGYVLLWVFGLTLILTVLDYFSLLGVKFASYLKLLIPLVAVIVGAYRVGKKSLKRGWLEGIKFGLIFILLITMLVYLLFHPVFDVKYFIYYLILLATSTLGGMIGISKREISVE